MIYTYDESGPSTTKAVMITGLTVVRADSPTNTEVVLNVSDGLVQPDGTVNWTGKRHVTIATSHIKAFGALMSDLYSGLAGENKVPKGGKLK